MAIKSLLVANRGEIAVRIIRAAQELGIRTVQIYSPADCESLAVEIADEAIEIGEPMASASYLDIKKVLAAAKEANVDAIHPGYGFLAENAEFADAVKKEGLIFIGPDGDMIRTMGDKASARQAAIMSGTPVVPGSDGVVSTVERGLDMAEEIGFPVMIKATAGGGGRGIRVAQNAEEFTDLFKESAAEAKAAFGDDGLYIEKLISDARHIEVQILGDGENHIHCFERECSIQRRRQKLWEEAPSVVLSDDVRNALCNSAVDLARSVKYKGAGTVEFLYDDSSGNYYFIEMNTRIQVEHPISECITNIDLVAEMIRIAAGQPLSISQDEVAILGHSIEVRLNAENPANNFMPFPGQISGLRIPGGPGIRFDHMMYEGYQIPPYYDSLLGKLIVYGPSREVAIMRLKRALLELRIRGVFSTQPLYISLANDADVQNANFHTNWLEPWLEKNQAKVIENQEALS